MAGSLANFVGRIEYSDHRLVKGWALDSGACERAIRIQVSSGSEAIGEIVPSIFRGDLRSKGYGVGCHGFVFPVPERESRAGATLCFRFAGTERELDNSPVVLSARDESRYQPYETADLTGNRVLVLAPHPDDESLACGGSLALHRLSGDPVKVLFLTDGSKAVPPAGCSEAELAALRRREADAACGILGIEDVEHWEVPDRALSRAEGVVDRLIGVLEAYEPTLVYAPSPMESHPDHRAAAELLWKGVQRARTAARIAFYDFNRPVNVNTLVDVTRVMDRKRAACNAHQSQVRVHPYTEAAESLNRYRALTVAGEADFVEGFFLMPAREVKSRPVDSFVLEQFLPLDRQGRGEDEPLVSIIIRTRDRPALLREALTSILAQTYSNLEIVVVNDGGADVAEVMAEVGRFLPVRQERHAKRLGRAAAANTGLRAAVGRYVVFLDDDDLLYPSHVEKLAGYLETTGESMAYSDCERVHYRWLAGSFEQIGTPQLFLGIDFDRDRLFYSNYIPFMTAMVRRDLALEAGGFDSSLTSNEDWDFWLRVARHTDFQRLPGVSALYRLFASHTNGPNLEVYRRHADHWTLERLASETWPRIEQLQEENHRLRLQALAREDELDAARQEAAAARQAADGRVRELEASTRESERLAEELGAEVARLEGRLETAEQAFQSVVGSYSWRATRIVPTGLRSWLKQRASRWLRGGDAPAPPSAEPYRVRPYAPGDEERILPLFERAFGKPQTPESWRWKFAENPSGAFAISLAVDPAGELLAHYGALPCSLEDHTSGTGAELPAYQICDTMTSRRARAMGRGRRSPLYRVTQDFFARFCEGQVALNFGFNTGKIQRYYLRLVPGSRFLEPAPNRVLELARRAPAESLPGGSAEYRVERVARFDHRFDELFERVAADYGVLQRRDSSYLNWRYLDRPGVDYAACCALAGDRLVGWAVFHRQHERLVWGDALFDRAHPGAAARLLDHAVAAHGGGELARVEGWFSSRPAWWAELVTGLGFEPRPDADDLGLIYLSFRDPATVARSLAQLYYMRGDSDLF